MQKSTVEMQNFRPGTSRGPRSARTLALRMAMELEQQEEVGRRLRALRGPKPQPVIADAIGVTLRAYHAWEAGESGIKWSNLQKLAELHGVSENYLLYGDEEPQGPQTQLDRLEAKIDHLTDLLVELQLSAVRQRKRKPGSGSAAAGDG